MSIDHDKIRLPALRSLQVFEVAARCQSFTAAAEELFITQSAVSRQVQELEQWLDTRLFVRSGPHLKITKTGKAMAERISQAMDTLHDAVQIAQPRPNNRHITLSMLPSLNTKWFAPRLGQFIQAHPDIDLRIAATQDLTVDFEADEIDAGVRYGTGNWANLSAELLAEETVTPVCSPAHAEQMNLKVPTDLLNATLLQTAGNDNWAAWFQEAGIKHHTEPTGPYLGDGAATLQAAIDGQGIALGRSILIADDLQAGRITAPFQLHFKASYSYWFVTPSNRAVSNNLIAVRDWLIQSFHSTKCPL